MKPNETQKLKQVYKTIFDTPAGKEIYFDLHRIANQSRISQDAPNPYSCVYKIAQQALLKRIENMCDMERTETSNIIERR
tara:strand:+ start:3097 stop:3336 length:240 start_codon:yes stop_codon:yes gene_type:complete